jgi:PAS domain S-box-containing protein
MGIVRRPVVLFIDPAWDLDGWCRTAFEAAGYRVITALDVTQAIEGLTAEPSDVVMTELGCVSSSGRTIVDQLKAVSHIPVVVITSETGGAALAALNAGADDVIAKPVSADLVVRRVTIVLQRSSSQRRTTRQLKRTLEALRINAAHQLPVDRHTREELFRLVQRIQVAVLLADDAGTTVAANEAACLLTGYRQAELFRQRFWPLVPPATPRVQEAVWNAFLCHGEWNDLLSLRRADGAFLRLEAIAMARLVPHVHAAALIRSPAS